MRHFQELILLLPRFPASTRSQKRFGSTLLTTTWPATSKYNPGQPACSLRVDCARIHDSGALRRLTSVSSVTALSPSHNVRLISSHDCSGPRSPADAPVYRSQSTDSATSHRRTFPSQRSGSEQRTLKALRAPRRVTLRSGTPEGNRKPFPTPPQFKSASITANAAAVGSDRQKIGNTGASQTSAVPLSDNTDVSTAVWPAMNFSVADNVNEGGNENLTNRHATFAAVGRPPPSMRHVNPSAAFDRRSQQPPRQQQPHRQQPGARAAPQRPSSSSSISTSATFSASQKRGKASTLPGGDLANACGVSALSADGGAAERVLAMLKSDQRRASPGCTLAIPELEEFSVPHTTLKRCVLRLPLPEVAQEVLAIGQSTKTKLARTLCYMHAEQLLDYFASEQQHRQQARRANEKVANSPASWPPPLEERRVTTTLPAPKERNFDSWDDYVDASDRYVQATAAKARAELLEQEQIPPSGHPVADRAAELLRRNRRRYTRPDALQELNESLRDGSQLIQTAHVAPKVFMATLKLDVKSGLTATGVAKNSKDAKRECAAHALCILHLLQHDAEGRPQGEAGEAWLSGKGKAAKQRIGPNDGEAESQRPGASLDAVLQQLQPSHGKLIRYFHLLFGSDALAPQTVFTRENAANGTHVYHCELTMGDITCTGKGVNRFEAERNAMEDGVTELLLYDERLQALQKFVDAYPSIAPESVPSAALPQALVRQLRQQLQPVAERQRAMAVAAAARMASAGAATAAVESSDNRRLNAEERALLRLTERAFASDAAYAARMRDDLIALRRNPTYLAQFHPRRSTLAMASVREQVVRAVEEHRVTVVCGTTGCGKTTQVPQYLLDHEIEQGRGGSCNILVTQPRRLSSFSVADRIAHERLSVVGKDVGYAVRLDARPGRHITVCTTGVLLQIFSTHPELEHVSHLIIDEVHERDINCDVILALVKELLTRNPTLRVVLMSATMQSDMFARYFGDDTPVIQVDGAVYPVAVRYLEDVAVEAAAARFYSPNFDAVPTQGDGGGGEVRPGQRSAPSAQTLLRRPPKTDYNLVAYLVHRAVQVDLGNNTAGKSILVFLPGWKELVSAKTAIERYAGPFAVSSLGVRFHIILLHSTVDSAKQRECFVPAPPGTVKVVLATNIAESGITIDDAAVVIDTGLIKTTTWAGRPAAGRYAGSPTSSAFVPIDQLSSEKSKDASTPTTTTTTTPVFSTQLTLGYASQANGTQRKGRAGRTQGGVCYRLYTKEMWEALPAFPEADIHRVPLTQVLLKLLSLGYAHPKQTLQTFLEPPSPTNVEVSMNLLRGIGAVNELEKLTPLGEYLAKLPCDPRIGKMIIMGAMLRCLDSVLTVAACADVSPYVTSREQSAAARKKRYLLARGSQSDHISFLNAYNAYCANGEREEFARFNLLHTGNLRIISKYKAQYRDILHHAGLIAEQDDDSAAAAVDADDSLDEDLLLDSAEDATSISDVAAAPDASCSGNTATTSSALVGVPLVYRGDLCVDTSPLSQNSFDVALVKACVCAALFPNVAVLRPPSNAGSPLRRRRQAEKVDLRTKHFTSIKPSKESACRRVGGPREHGIPKCNELLDELHRDASGSDGAAASSSAPTSTKTVPALFYVFQDVFGVKEARQEFLTTLSSVSLWALLLFGASESTTHYDEVLSLCVIDGWIAVHIDAATCQLITELRHALYACLHGKYHHPQDEQNNAALRTVTEICRAVLKAPVLTNTPAAADGTGGEQHAVTQSSRLVDTGSIIDPLALVRHVAVGNSVTNGDADFDSDDEDGDEDEEEDEKSAASEDEAEN